MLRWSSSSPYGSGINLGMEESSIALPIRPTYRDRLQNNPSYKTNAAGSDTALDISVFSFQPYLNINMKHENKRPNLVKQTKLKEKYQSKSYRNCWNYLWLSSIGVQLVPTVGSVVWIQSSVTIWVDRMDGSGGWANSNYKTNVYPSSDGLTHARGTSIHFNKPISIIHVSSPVEACIGLWWGSCPVVIVACWWSIVIVAGHSVRRIVYRHHTSWTLPVPHGYRVSRHTSHWTPTIKGKCVWHRGDDCSSGGGLYYFLYLKQQNNTINIYVFV